MFPLCPDKVASDTCWYCEAYSIHGGGGLFGRLVTSVLRLDVVIFIFFECVVSHVSTATVHVCFGAL